MHPHQIIEEGKAQQYIAICRRGFDNEHAHKAWMEARIIEMQSWPEKWRLAVVVAWMNSGPKELTSGASAPTAPTEDLK